MNIPKPTILQGQGLKAEGQYRGQRKGRKGKKKDEIHGFDLSMGKPDGTGRFPALLQELWADE